MGQRFPSAGAVRSPVPTANVVHSAHIARNLSHVRFIVQNSSTVGPLGTDHDEASSEYRFCYMTRSMKA